MQLIISYAAGEMAISLQLHNKNLLRLLYSLIKKSDGGYIMATIKITKHNFDTEVLNSKEPVLLDFWASWCGPCRMVAPTIDEIAEEARGKVKVGKINVDEEAELASRFRIMSIPTLVVIKDGKVAAQAVGVRPKNDILNLLNA